MYCQLRSAEKLLFEGEATMVVAHSPTGEFAVMADHAPFLAELDAGSLRIKTDAEEHTFAVLTGLLRVTEQGVSILAREAIPAAAIDLPAVQKRREEVEEALSSNPQMESLRLELACLLAQERLGEKLA
jgi:F-type H+-transporting ATPase subunit epsilon